MNNLGDYYDLHVQSDTLLLADVFENFRSKCFEIYELDPAHFLSAPELAWQACLKKTGINIDVVNMLLMVEKGGICHAKANNKYMKNYNKSKESPYIQYLGANNLYGWEMSQKLPVNGFEWVKDISGPNKKLKKFIKHVKNYDEGSDKGYILEVDVEYLKDLHDLHSDLPFLPERLKINKCNKLVCTLYDKNFFCPHKTFKTSIKS